MKSQYSGPFNADISYREKKCARRLASPANPEPLPGCVVLVDRSIVVPKSSPQPVTKVGAFRLRCRGPQQRDNQHANDHSGRSASPNVPRTLIHLPHLAMNRQCHSSCINRMQRRSSKQVLTGLRSHGGCHGSPDGLPETLIPRSTAIQQLDADRDRSTRFPRDQIAPTFTGHAIRRAVLQCLRSPS